MTRKLCLITGASAGIGAAFARIYASHGYDVALTARRGDRLETLAEEIRLRCGVETIPIVADLAHAGAVDQILAEITAHGRTVNALVNAWRTKPVGSEGYRTAEVTLGGVDTRGLDQKTMAARGVPGLYFIGEVVDVTGWLGGYNFQWAWASGWSAGQVA